MTQHKKNSKQTPTQTIKRWISDFVTRPNPVFGDLPPCPFAQRAIIDGRVEFLELDGVADYPTLSQHIAEFDFDEKDVLVMIAEPDHFTAAETERLAHDLNGYYMSRDIVVLEDHPEINERVKDVKLNNGEYILFLAQRLSKLNRYSEMLEKGPYYRNWSKTYLESVKGFRDRKKSRS
jgi:hypothetical protein